MMFYRHAVLAILAGSSSQFRWADANVIDQIEQTDASSAIVQPMFDFEEPACTCACEVEPGTEGVIISVDTSQGPFGGKIAGQVLNFCVPVEYEQYIFDLFAAFPNLPQPICVDAADGCPDVVIPVPLPDPDPMCECPCELDGTIKDKEPQAGVIVTASPWLFHACIPEDWAAFFLFIPSIITPILQLPSTDFTCADPDAGGGEKGKAKEGGCPTKLVIPFDLPTFPDIPQVPIVFP
jgi:hypothetical protein